MVEHVPSKHQKLVILLPENPFKAYLKVEYAHRLVGFGCGLQCDGQCVSEDEYEISIAAYGDI